MGQATINSGGPTGLYSVKIVKDAGKSVARQTAITTRLADLAGLITMATTNVNTALAELASAQTTLNDAIAEMVDETTRKAVTDATTAVLTKQQSVSRARMTYASLIVEQQSLQKEQARLTTAMEDESMAAWCADLTENLATGATVGTAEINGEGDQIIILPGGATTNALGKLQHAGVSTGAAVFYNKALLPCWQKWKPTYRVGTITELDKEADTASVTLDVAVGEQGLDINQEASLVDIPIEYMTYNASAFNVGRRVLIEFEDQEWSGAKIIGFESYPGTGMEYYFIHNFETAVDQPDYVWDMAEPDNYEFDYGTSSLTSDAKFGNYGLQLREFQAYYSPNAADNLDFDTPYTLEYWFKVPVPNTGIDAYFNLAWGNTSGYGVYQIMLYRRSSWPLQYPVEFTRWVCDLDDNELVDDDTTAIPFTYSEWHHFAMVLTDNKLRYYFDGVKHDEFISPSPTGFKGRPASWGNFMDTWEFIDTSNYSDPGGLEVIIDAWSVTRSEKYTANFTPPTEPPSV